MNFEVISEITEIEIIAVGRKIRELARFAPKVWSWSLAKAERRSEGALEKR
jgi:hypothetical protein